MLRTGRIRPAALAVPVVLVTLGLLFSLGCPPGGAPGGEAGVFLESAEQRLLDSWIEVGLLARRNRRLVPGRKLVAVPREPEEELFAMSRPDGRHVYVNFAPPDNASVQVIYTLKGEVISTLEPGPAVLHMEFAPRGAQVWMSVRDADEIQIWDTARIEKVATIPARKPSGIFFTARAHRIGL